MLKKKKRIYSGKGQVERLIKQHKKSKGVEGIFGKEARKHDAKLYKISEQIYQNLKNKYPHLKFYQRRSISKKEINEKLNSFNERFGKVLFVKNSNIKPDGGIIEVLDINNNRRVILISESKHQGNDVEKIRKGIKQGKNKDQDLMVAGNAIERVHKNILELRNFMLDENHFPYVVFLQGSNFAIKTHFVKTPKGKKVKIPHNAGNLNRIDRVTASSYSMEINTNHCKNIKIQNHSLHITSFYCQCDTWSSKHMLKIMTEIANTSLEVLSSSGVLSFKN